MWLVRAGSIVGFEQLVLELGRDPNPLLKEAGFSPAQLQNPNTYISYTKMAGLLDQAALSCQDPFFGLRLASQQSNMVLGEISLVATQLPTVADALAYLTRYIHLHAKGVVLTTEVKTDHLQVGMDFQFTNAFNLRHLFQLSLGLMLNMSRYSGNNKQKTNIHLTQSMQVPPKLKASSSKKKNHLALPEIYANQVTFSSSFNGAEIPFSLLDEKPEYEESDLVEYFEHRVKLLNTLYPDNIRAQTQYIISNLLANSACTLDRVAESLNLHPRVLQQRLQKEGTGFRELLLEARKGFAIDQLQHQEIRISDLALSLGYAEVSVFSRNFKKWTGYSPREWRKLHVQV